MVEPRLYGAAAIAEKAKQERVAEKAAFAALCARAGIGESEKINEVELHSRLHGRGLTLEERECVRKGLLGHGRLELRV